MTPSDRPTLGQPRTQDGLAEHSRALDVTIDDALIAPENWRTVDLGPLSGGRDAPLAVTARFGLTGLAHGNDNPASTAHDPVAAPDPARDVPDDMFLGAGPVANDDEALPAAPPAPRVFRRAGLAESLATARNLADMDPGPAVAAVAAPPSEPVTVAPMTVMPLPVQPPIDWAAWREYPQVRTTGLDRSAVTTLVVIMIGVWAAGVGFGLYKLSTPSYGTKILWER